MSDKNEAGGEPHASLRRLPERGTSPAALVAGAPAGSKQTEPKRTGSKQPGPRNDATQHAGGQKGGAGKSGAQKAGTGRMSQLVQAARPPQRWVPVAAAAAVVAVALPLALKYTDGSDRSSSDASESAQLSSGGYGEELPAGDPLQAGPAPSASKSGKGSSTSPGADTKTGQEGRTDTDGGAAKGSGTEQEIRKKGGDGQQEDTRSSGTVSEDGTDSEDGTVSEDGTDSEDGTVSEDGTDSSDVVSGDSGGTTAKAPTGWEGVKRSLTSDRAGTCLAVGSERAVVVGTCGPANTWERMMTDDGSFLLRHASGNRCLDSGGDAMYVSPCTTADSGQLWRSTTASSCSVHLTSPRFGTYVTVWNTGTVGLGSASASSDAPAKRSWTVSPALPEGC
ncbi:hypothetical protein [Streptomyces sp. NPDC060184]|uniref:hypothetical protein n=1 Tax=Streptomyces sp. NPDC060184 TaxID=3347064 RepID=UPI0036589910